MHVVPLPVRPLAARAWFALTPLVTLTAALVICQAAPARAQSMSLGGTVWTTYVPAIQQSFTNVPSVSLSGLHAFDDHLNDGEGAGALATPLGRFTLSSHACSGGGPGRTGQANSSTNAAVVIDYKIVSATLPLGTPVQVTVRWAISSKVTAVGEDMVGVNTTCSASVYGQAAVSINGVLVTNKTGSYSMTHAAYSDFQKITGGTLKVLGDANDSTSTNKTVLVGQTVRVTMNAQVGAASSVEQGTNDADAQVAMVWGATSLNSAASVVLLSDPTQPAPPAESATPAAADSLRPPRPVPPLLPCCRISTQPHADSTCSSGTASLSVTPLGTGPFTYRWRKNGVPMDTDLYPTSTSQTLVLTNLTASDAGSYDVVITNPCGDVISDATTLTVCAVSVDTDRGPWVTRLAAARPAQFHGSSTLVFELAAAGDARLEVFDARGVRVRTLASGWQKAGHTTVVWRGDDDAGHRVPSGLYFARFHAGGFAGTTRLVALP